MHPHLRNSMWFLYMKDDVSHEEFLATVYEAENEGTESKVLNVKAKAVMVEKVIEERERSELKDLKQQIELLSTIMKSATIGTVKTKGREGVPLPRKKELLGSSTQKRMQGWPKEGKISLRPGQKPLQCFQCEDWGHGWHECLTLENFNWRELAGAGVLLTPESPGSTPIQTQSQNQWFITFWSELTFTITQIHCFGLWERLMNLPWW